MTHRLRLVQPAEGRPSDAATSPGPDADRSSASVSPRLELAFKCRDDLQTALGQFVLPLDCIVADLQSFRCSLIIGRLGGNTVAELRVDASRLVRRASHIAGRDAGTVQVLWVLSGRTRLRQGPTSAVVEVGGWAVIDPRREYSLDLEKGSRTLFLIVRRSACPGWLPTANLLFGCGLRPGGPAHIAMASLTAMLREADPLDAKSDAMLLESVVALVGRALTIEIGARGLAAHKDRGIQLSQVLGYIAEHLSDPRLNVAALASVFGVSRRNLYNIFLPSHKTPHSCIQSARLDRACALLDESSIAAVPVASIARECGFSDPAHFSRAFRARHKVAPTAWRDRAR